MKPPTPPKAFSFTNVYLATIDGWHVFVGADSPRNRESAYGIVRTDDPDILGDAWFTDLASGRGFGLYSDRSVRRVAGLEGVIDFCVTHNQLTA